MSLVVTPNLSQPDTFYEQLVGSQRDMSEDEASQMNARLVLVLANHIGDLEVLRAAISLASLHGCRP